MKYKKYNKYKKMLTSVYDAHKNKNHKRVISIEQLCLSVVLKMRCLKFLNSKAGKLK